MVEFHYYRTVFGGGTKLDWYPEKCLFYLSTVLKVILVCHVVVRSPGVLQYTLQVQ